MENIYFEDICKRIKNPQLNRVINVKIISVAPTQGLI